MKFLQITAPHFVAAIEVGGRCAPILSYMRAWPEQRIRDYCARKGWLVVSLER